MNRFLKKLWPIGVLVIVLGAFIYLRWIDRYTPDLPKQKIEQREIASWRDHFSASDLDLLARAVRAEAQGEPYDGQVAVAAVILNRVKDANFPNTIAGVVYEPLAFSVVANGQINKPATESAVQAAHCALNGLDPSGGALYFYNPAKTRNKWIRSRAVIKTIGDHIFAS